MREKTPGDVNKFLVLALKGCRGESIKPSVFDCMRMRGEFWSQKLERLFIWNAKIGKIWLWFIKISRFMYYWEAGMLIAEEEFP